MQMKYINFKSYEVQKCISEQLRTLAWAIAGVYAYLGLSQNKIISGVTVVFSWVAFMVISLMVLTSAEKQKSL